MAARAKKSGGAGGGDKTECVKVAVRLRPLNRREREEQQVSCVETDSIRGSVWQPYATTFTTLCHSYVHHTWYVYGIIGVHTEAR